MATTGARLGELMDSDNVLDITLETNTITIDTQLTRDSSWRPLNTTKRIFVQPDVLRAVLEMTTRYKKDPKRRQRLSLLTFGVFWFIWSLLEIFHLLIIL